MATKNIDQERPGEEQGPMMKKGILKLASEEQGQCGCEENKARCKKCGKIMFCADCVKGSYFDEEGGYWLCADCAGKHLSCVSEGVEEERRMMQQKKSNIIWISCTKDCEHCPLEDKDKKCMITERGIELRHHRIDDTIEAAIEIVFGGLANKYPVEVLSWIRRNIDARCGYCETLNRDCECEIDWR